MKKSFYLLGAAAAALAGVSSCAGGSGEGSGRSDVTEFVVNQVIKTADRNYRVETDYDTAYVDVYASIHWPEKLGDADLTPLRRTLLEYAFNDTTSTTLEGALDSYLGDISFIEGVKSATQVDSLPAGPDGIGAYFNSVTATVLDLDEEMATYQVTTSAYLGGAHPMTASHPFTYVLKSGTVLDVDNILTKAGQDSIMPIIINALARQLEVPVDGLEKAGIFTSQLTSPGYPYISNNTLYFHYNPYDIAPYSRGMVDVAVYPYEVDRFLTPEAKALFDEGY